MNFAGLIVDLGYVSHELFQSCQKHDVSLVVRLKDGWRLRLDDTVTGAQSLAWIASEEAITRLDEGASLATPPEGTLDVDVLQGPTSMQIAARLVSVETKEGWRYLLTNLTRSTHTAEEVSML